jgi:sec-independent protein translocase protein TatB
MNFFGLGFGEIFLILLIVLVVVGPERLPTLARQTGLLIARVQSWIQRSPDAMMIMQARKELEREIENLRNEMVQMQQAQKQLVESAQQMIQQPLDELKAVGEELKSIPTTASDSGGVKPAQPLPPIDESPVDEPEPLPPIDESPVDEPEPLIEPELPAEPAAEPVHAEGNGYRANEPPPAAAEPELEFAAEQLDAPPETALNWGELELPPDAEAPLPKPDPLLEPVLQAVEETAREAHEATLAARADELALRLQALAADLAALRADLAAERPADPQAARPADEAPLAPAEHGIV